MRQAKPLSLITLSKPGGTAVQAGGVSPAAAAPSARGTDTGDSTVYPNSANGIVYGYYDPVDPFAYQCSGSVINTPTGNVVLTAGHCVIDPGTGTPATDLIFVPGFRDFNEPYGEWTAPTFATTSQWQSTAGGPNPNEAGDMAMLTLDNRPSDSATLQSVVGAVGIAFNQPRVQTYMEYGYPAEFPYDGTRLYELTSPWGRDDTQFSPATMGISSDFTGGSSGGPWLVGNAPQAESVSDYVYTSAPPSWLGYMYGPYFGSIAQNLFVSATAQRRFGAGTLVQPADRPSEGHAFEQVRDQVDHPRPTPGHGHYLGQGPGRRNPEAQGTRVGQGDQRAGREGDHLAAGSVQGLCVGNAARRRSGRCGGEDRLHADRGRSEGEVPRSRPAQARLSRDPAPLRRR